MPLVTLEEAKRFVGIPSGTAVENEKLVGILEAAVILVEGKVGPVTPRRFEEWHEGGNTYIMLRRRPSSALGTTPLIQLVACSEYLGPIEWPLKIIPSPDLGELYSCELDGKLAQVVRRSAGGCVQPFPYGPRAVHVVYEAGQEETPANIKIALLEAIREFWQATQQTGGGRRTLADEDLTTGGGQSLGYLIDRHVTMMLGPMKRFPSVA